MSLTTGLYDSARQVHYVKPRWRGRFHLVWFAVSLVAGPWLVLTTGGNTARTAMTVYAVGVSGLFGVSAFYHCGTWSAAAARSWQRLDHVMIFVLIASSATPIYLLGTPTPFGAICLLVTWIVTVTAIVVHLFWMHAPEKLVGAVFIGLGSSAGVALPALWLREGAVPVVLILVGGALYATGAVLYHRRRPDPWPSVFGYHEVFHAFVCAAAVCHFVAVAAYLR